MTLQNNQISKLKEELETYKREQIEAKSQSQILIDQLKQKDQQMIDMMKKVNQDKQDIINYSTQLVSFQQKQSQEQQAKNDIHIKKLNLSKEVETVLLDIAKIVLVSDNKFDIQKLFKNRRDANQFYYQITRVYQQQQNRSQLTQQGQRYTEIQADTAFMQAIMYNQQGYNLQKQISAKDGINLPSYRYIQMMKQKIKKQYQINDNNIGYVFDKETLKSMIPQWKQQNNIDEHEQVIVNVSQDAMALTARVSEKNGVLSNTIQEQDGKIYPVSHVFVYIMSAEKEYSFLPIFSQFATSGATNTEQLVTWFAIKEALQEYSITVKFYPHDGDTWFSRLDAYELEVIKTNYIDYMDRNPYKMTENQERVKEKLKFQFRELISMTDSKHLLKIIRNLINTQLKLSLSNKLDNQYFDASIISNILNFLPPEVFSSNEQLKMNDNYALQEFSSECVNTLMERVYQMMKIMKMLIIKCQSKKQVFIGYYYFHLYQWIANQIIFNYKEYLHQCCLFQFNSILMVNNFRKMLMKLI
ncbi:Hypothetical_protein [Hexamita inflata]|uniref:Hypothetical_protein n=1 Tax=Hexamita inflata TaxID=28002 RepID=A0AA86QHH9_9EUKA|nr:Hypothetical protein HINF_LOCUS46520 [Hexamita inflata]